MSQIKANIVQAGISITPANNFQLDASSDDGTASFKRSNGTEILSIDAAGNLIDKSSVSSVDTTAGRLLKIGDFGIGRLSSGIDPVDCNTIYATGMYIVSSTSTNNPSSNTGFMIVQSYSVDRTSQLWQSMSTGELFVRANYGAGWTSWRKQYGQGNILGTASQSAGIPTGAIIETGSNANGTYTKFADGTLVIRRLVSGVFTAGVSNTYSLPVDAASPQYNFVGTSIIPTAGVIPAIVSWQQDSNTVYIRSATSFSQAVVIVVIGRWF